VEGAVHGQLGNCINRGRVAAVTATMPTLWPSSSAAGRTLPARLTTSPWRALLRSGRSQVTHGGAELLSVPGGNILRLHPDLGQQQKYGGNAQAFGLGLSTDFFTAAKVVAS